MAGTLTFKTAAVAVLLADAERAWAEAEPRVLYEEVTGKGFWLVGDDGVYLMHNGMTHVKQGGGFGPPFAVVYAEETPVDDYEAKQRIFGGDDGVEFIQACTIQRIVKEGGDFFQVKLTAKSIRVVGPAKLAMSVYGMPIRETMKEAGYVHHKNLGDGQHVLKRVSDGKLEIWFCNKNHASYGIKWRGTDLEFASSCYTE